MKENAMQKGRRPLCRLGKKREGKKEKVELEIG